MVIEELPGGVLQGYSAALNLNLRWDNGQLVWRDPATGRRIVTLEDTLVRADTAETRADQAEARIQQLEAELDRLRSS